MKVENCYFPVDFIFVDMKTTKDFTDAPIILGRPFFCYHKSHYTLGQRKSDISGRREYYEGEHQ